MNKDKLKLAAIFQILPVTLLIVIVGIAIVQKANPDVIMTQFWQGMEFVLFFFVAGIPFEIMLLSHYEQDLRREGKKTRYR
jgi:hypothetical protein